MMMFARLLQIAVLIGLIFACYSCGVWVTESATIAANNPQGIDMIQPGTNAEDDFANSQTNLNNSGANLNNSEAQLNLAKATAVIVDSQGNYAVNAARATQIVADSDWGPVNTYNAGQAAGEADAGKRLLWVVGVIAAVLVVGSRLR